MPESTAQPPGPAADAQGRSVVDPSENVKALNDASVRRLDDMAEQSTESMRREIKSLRREMKAEAKHQRELMKKDATHHRDLMKAESKRLDATRQVDVQAVAAAAGVQATGAATLQAQVSDTAEAQRQSQEAQRQATDMRLVAALDPIQKDVIALRETQWTGRGKDETTKERGVSLGVWVAIGVAVFFGVSTLMVSITAVSLTVLFFLLR